MNVPADGDPRRLAVRFVDAQSGRNDLLGRVAALEAMAGVVARRLEGERPGSRFPLLRLVGREQPLTPAECDALAREVARLRQMLAPVPAQVLAEDAATTEPAPEWFRRVDGEGAPRSLADAFAWPLFVLEHIARLGATSRRGARFEVGDAEAFASACTPLSPHEAHLSDVAE